MRPKRLALPLTAALTVLLLSGPFAVAGDWPQWRHNARRTAATDESLPAKLYPQWSIDLGKARQAWTDKSNARSYFDVSYEPIVVGKLLIVGSMNNDSVTAYDTNTGAEKWRFFTEGPVRFAPAAYKDKVFVGSDDGYLYCLAAKTGKLIRKFLAAPSKRKILGHGRLISAWPVRGGPVVRDGKVYFSAGIWPFMGVFIYAMDAESGEVLWCNSATGAEWINYPHGGAIGFGGLAPQGSFAVSEDHLIVPSGRAVPAVFDRATGKFLHYAHSKGSKNDGGFAVATMGKYYFNGYKAYPMDTGKGFGTLPRNAVYADGKAYGVDGGKFTSVELKSFTKQIKDRRGERHTTAFFPEPVTHAGSLSITRVFCKAGNRFYAAGRDGVAAIELTADGKAKTAWERKVEGTVWNILAADGRLFVVTADGRIHCFDGTPDEPGPRRTFMSAYGKIRGIEDLVAGFVRTAGTNAGYCILFGHGTTFYGPLATELNAKTKFHTILIHPQASVVRSFRSKMGTHTAVATGGLFVEPGTPPYGHRVAAANARAAEVKLPPYLAHLIYCGDIKAAGFVDIASAAKKMFRSLRPYGGAAILDISDTEYATLEQIVAAGALPGAELIRNNKHAVLRRVGPLPGSAPWTHQYADAANTGISRDTIVKPPLGLLWFGGASNDPILPRHGHGPSPQVVGGRLFIEGPNIIRAVDVYTGRLLWERTIPDVGKYYNNTSHHPGAGDIGSNYVSQADGVYVMTPDKCQILDPATGKTTKTIILPADCGNWGSLRIWKDYLIATAGPLSIKPPKKKKGEAAPARTTPKLTPLTNVPGVTPNDRYASSSKTLLVLDRHTGKVLWRREAKYNFRHNAIAAAAGKVFCVDSMVAAKLAYLNRRGVPLVGDPTLYALDAKTGKVVWDTDKDVFGTFLLYSAKHDLLLQAGSANRDRASDDVGRGIVAYHAATGKVIWRDLRFGYGGPLMIRHDEFITNGSAGKGYSLLTGKPTGWSWQRWYGCNTAIGSEHLLTFRSGSAGYYDLTGKSGTGNLGGFKSSCTANLIVADGVFNAPDYTRTCTCSYANQTSLALIPMADADMWTFAGQVDLQGGKFGVNFGAPGDRKDDNGVFWFDWPTVSGEYPASWANYVEKRPAVTVTGAKPTYFRHHASQVRADAADSPTWVAASGVEGATKITIAVKPGRYAVQLHFVEPNTSAKTGDRVFAVTLQGKNVLPATDIAKTAGGARKAVTWKGRAEVADGKLTIGLKPGKGQPVLCGVELIRQN